MAHEDLLDDLESVSGRLEELSEEASGDSLHLSANLLLEARDNVESAIDNATYPGESEPEDDPGEESRCYFISEEVERFLDDNNYIVNLACPITPEQTALFDYPEAVLMGPAESRYEMEPIEKFDTIEDMKSWLVSKAENYSSQEGSEK